MSGSTISSPPEPAPSALEQGLALLQQGKFAASLPLFQEAIRDDPMNPDIWYHASAAANAVGDHEFAERLLRSYLSFNPNRSSAWVILAHALFGRGRYEAAAEAMRRVSALRPQSHHAHAFLSQLALMNGSPEESMAEYRTMLALEPRNASDRTERAILDIVHGRFEDGWRAFHDSVHDSLYRLLVPGWRDFSDRRWQGEEVPDRTVVLHSDGGFGDTVLFGRFVPAASGRVGRLLLNAPVPLRRLLADLPGHAGWATPEEVQHPDTLHASMWSLPAFTGAMIDDLPGTVPYLRVPADGPSLPPARDPTSLRVGLVWAGNPGTKHDADRSCPSLEVFAPLFNVPGIDWVALQVGHRVAEGDAHGLARCPAVHDFADTAYLIAQLDLLITVDTGVANLAGAIGATTWILPPTYPEFRWFLDRSDSPWYPTARLFRRRHSRDWPALADDLARALRQFVASTDRPPPLLARRQCHHAAAPQ